VVDAGTARAGPRGYDRIVPGIPDLGHELATATVAARVAGAIVLERYERLERIVHKSEKDVVTEVDHLSEAAIIETIRATFPADAFLAEESGHTPSAAAVASVAGRVETGARLWIVDPLDGTVNYANGLPFFAVSVGLAIDGRPVLGVVLDPLRDELFSAVEGQGATLDGGPIRLPVKERLIDAVAHVGLPRSGFARRSAALHKAVRITRSMGSAALGLTYVANGRFDAYVQWRGLSLWDVCAAGVIAAEGGALVTAPDGGPWFDLARPSKSVGIVAAAAPHHAALRDLLA
jgi:myo-inositol-1(or 4)-monophosphatase